MEMSENEVKLHSVKLNFTISAEIKVIKSWNDSRKIRDNFLCSSMEKFVGLGKTDFQLQIVEFEVYSSSIDRLDCSPCAGYQHSKTHNVILTSATSSARVRTPQTS